MGTPKQDFRGGDLVVALSQAGQEGDRLSYQAPLLPIPFSCCPLVDAALLMVSLLFPFQGSCDHPYT